jgi:hypothetical protein
VAETPTKLPVLVVACSIVAATPRPGLFIRLSGQGLFPRTYHRSQILFSEDSSAAGLFKAAPGCSSPAVVYRTVQSAEEAASLLPKVTG